MSEVAQIHADAKVRIQIGPVPVNPKPIIVNALMPESRDIR